MANLFLTIMEFASLRRTNKTAGDTNNRVARATIPLSKHLQARTTV